MVVVSLILAPGCADRERNNPFDPLNPETGGRPHFFEAVAGDESAALSWRTVDFEDLTGFLLVRSGLGELKSADSTVFEFDRSVTGFIDLGLENGETYRYRLAFLFSARPAWTNEDTLTPGPAVSWVLDGYAGSLIRLSPDGRDRAAEFETGSIFSDLAADESDGSAWITDYYDRKIHHVDVEGRTIESIDLDGYPVSIALDPVRRRIWVSQTQPELVTMFEGDGTEVSYEDPLHPSSISVDERTGALWACSSVGGWVMRIDEEGMKFSYGFDSPVEIEDDPLDGGAWVVCRDRIVEVNAEPSAVFAIGGFDGPMDVSMDRLEGDLWVADTGGSRVARLDRNGVLLAEFTGLDEPYSVSYDELAGECWIADSMAGEIVRISRDGELLRRAGGFLAPFVVEVIPGIQ